MVKSMVDGNIAKSFTRIRNTSPLFPSVLIRQVHYRGSFVTSSDLRVRYLACSIDKLSDPMAEPDLASLCLRSQRSVISSANVGDCGRPCGEKFRGNGQSCWRLVVDSEGLCFPDRGSREQKFSRQPWALFEGL